MISTSTFAFVLALVAVASVVGVSITLLRLTLAQAQWRSTMRSDYESFKLNVDARLRAVETTSPKALAATVAELSDAVAKQADIHQRFAGRVWQRIGKNAPQQDGFEVSGDDELAALLRLQSASTPQR